MVADAHRLRQSPAISGLNKTTSGMGSNPRRSMFSCLRAAHCLNNGEETGVIHCLTFMPSWARGAPLDRKQW